MYIFHDHLDGGLLPNTLLEMAINTSYEPIMNLTESEVRILMNKSNSNSLEDFLSAFVHTISVMQRYDNLERIAYEAAESMHIEGIKYNLIVYIFEKSSIQRSHFHSLTCF